MNQVGDIITIGPGANFRLEREIASASYGTVWSATWIEAGSMVALKTVRHGRMQAHLQQDRHLWPQSLMREIAFLETIRAAHIVSFLRKGEHDGLLVMVMEELDTSLQKLIQPDPTTTNPVNLPMALEWLRQITDGVRATHRRGLRHLDLKPNNLLLTKDGVLGRRIRIADFGDIKPAQEAMHTFCGTVGWQAPEQFFPCMQTAQGFHYQTDHRADIFALGLLFFYLITGEKTNFAQRTTLMHRDPEAGAWRARNDGILTLTSEDRGRFLHALGDASTALDEESTWHPGIAAPEPPMQRVSSTAALALLEYLLAVAPDDRPEDADAALDLIDEVILSVSRKSEGVGMGRIIL